MSCGSVLATFGAACEVGRRADLLIGSALPPQRFAATAAGLVALVSSALADTLTINTPTTTLQSCHPLALSWSGGTAPYYLYVYSESTMTMLEQLTTDPIDATSGTWTINVAAGTEIYFLVTDNTGTSASSSGVTVTAGSSTDCTTTTYFSYAGATTTAAAATSSSAATTTTAAAVVSSASSAASSASSAHSSAASAAHSSSASVASASASAWLSSVEVSASSAASSASSALSSAASSASSAGKSELHSTSVFR